MYKRFVLLAANIFERPFLEKESIADRFMVMEHLGAGSYGHSYLVNDLVTQQKKVLKALRIHKRITKSWKNSFQFEKELLKTINHPGFPKYFEDGTYKNIPFYTMEHIEGKNFEQLIFHDSKSYSEAAAFSVANDLLTLIDHLHENNIIHRDIRIPNVIASGSGIRLIDLGLARKLPLGTASQDKSNQNLRKETNPQADFYGLGHFLLFLLYSNFSFPKNKKESSWEEELNISYDAKHIIKRLLQSETPYQSCTEIKSDIQKLFKNLGGNQNVFF